MDCPKCGSAMQPVVFQEVEVDRCGACHGIWFDALELDKLTELAGAELIDPPTAAGDGGAKSPRATEMGAKRLCPHCRNPMIGMTAHGQPHIRFESCTVCYGAFLDAGEFRDLKQETLMERIRHFFRRT